MLATSVSGPKYERVSDLETDLLMNFTVKVSLEIVEEELEYYYSAKQKLVELVVGNIDVNKLDPVKTENLLKQYLFNKNDVAGLIRRTEKRINREVLRTVMVNYHLDAEKYVPEFEIEVLTEQIKENIRTLKVSNLLAKTIDMAWKRTSKEFIPKSLMIFTSKFKASDYILSLAGVKPSDVKASLNTRLARIIQGMLKQECTDLRRTLSCHLINLVYKPEPLAIREVLYEDIKTA